MFVINLFTVILLVSDGMMKTRSAHAKLSEDQSLPEQQPEVERELPVYEQLVYADDSPYEPKDYTQAFNFASSVMWIDLLYLEGLFIALMSWCFYFQTNRAI